LEKFLQSHHLEVYIDIKRKAGARMEDESGFKGRIEQNRSGKEGAIGK
jgi:hypothetical protein